MSDRKMLLCLDSETLHYPETIGLEGEALESETWLDIVSDPFEARRIFRADGDLDAAWVVSSDAMDGINLAAALKRDGSNRAVDLISFDAAGSVLGRCEAAGVGLIRSRDQFASRYALCKERFRAKSREVCSQSRSSGEAITTSTLEVEEPGDPIGSFDLVPPRIDAPALLRGSEIAKSEADLIASVTFEKSKATHEACVVAVVSGSGSVGKSTVAASAAVYLQSSGKKTLLLDADLQFGDMGYLLRLDDAIGIEELMADPQRIDQLEGQGALPALIASPKRLEQSELIMGRMAELIEYVKGYFDFVIINTGAFWSEQHAQIIESADKVLFMLDQRPSSIRACSHALDLCRRCGIATKSFHFVLNFCSRHAILTSFDVSCALEGSAVKELKDGGKEVGELLGAGLPRELLAEKNPFSESLRKLCDEVLIEHGGEEEALAAEGERGKRRGLLSRLRRGRAACL